MLFNVLYCGEESLTDSERLLLLHEVLTAPETNGLKDKYSSKDKKEVTKQVLLLRVEWLVMLPSLMLSAVVE